jgi:hypothetical protein
MAGLLTDRSIENVIGNAANAGVLVRAGKAGTLARQATIIVACISEQVCGFGTVIKTDAVIKDIP